MYCKKCGTELRENDTFCYYCGNRIGWMQRMLSSKAFIGSVIAVFVVIIAAVLTYLIWTGKITMPSFDKGQTTEQNKIVDSGKSERIQIIRQQRQQLRRHRLLRRTRLLHRM